MFTKVTTVSIVVLLALLLLTVSVYAAPMNQEPTPIPPLHDCQCVADYQANMWRYHPVLDATMDAKVPAVLTMPLNGCQEVAEYQASLWQLEQGE